jgi:hypothetical protein
MAIDNTPLPRFIADACRDGIPSGRFAERLTGHFREAVERIEDLPAGTQIPEQVTWFPERSWHGRIWVPASAVGEAVIEPDSEPVSIEFFGYVSYVQPEEADLEDIQAVADFTDVVAADNPDWRVDLGDEVIGTWNGERGRQADITLVWGTSLVPNGFAVTAEIAGVTVDQDPLFEDRFTLVAPDALKKYSDDHFLEVCLWDERGRELARESLYEIPEAAEAAEAEESEAEPEPGQRA